jgi:catechol 2,3-dioxygenase-like lactoylglutathione lyase family enzyme
MQTLHTAYRVADLDRSLGFYHKVGFREIGRVATSEQTVSDSRCPGQSSNIPTARHCERCSARHSTAVLLGYSIATTLGGCILPCHGSSGA